MATIRPTTHVRPLTAKILAHPIAPIESARRRKDLKYGANGLSEYLKFGECLTPKMYLLLLHDSTDFRRQFFRYCSHAG